MISPNRRPPVLAVDDDPAILEYYRKLLAPCEGDLDILGDFEATCEETPDLRCFRLPSELLDHCRRERARGVRFPLAILDMRMPEKNGLETAAERPASIGSPAALADANAFFAAVLLAEGA